MGSCLIQGKAGGLLFTTSCASWLWISQISALTDLLAKKGSSASAPGIIIVGTMRATMSRTAGCHDTEPAGGVRNGEAGSLFKRRNRGSLATAGWVGASARIA